MGAPQESRIASVIDSEDCVHLREPPSTAHHALDCLSVPVRLSVFVAPVSLFLSISPYPVNSSSVPPSLTHSLMHTLPPSLCTSLLPVLIFAPSLAYSPPPTHPRFSTHACPPG